LKISRFETRLPYLPYVVQLFLDNRRWMKVQWQVSFDPNESLSMSWSGTFGASQGEKRHSLMLQDTK
jgi:hypothetical protein